MNKIVCAWCGIELSSGAEPVSHGICGECLACVEKEERSRSSSPLIAFVAMAVTGLVLAFIFLGAAGWL